MERTKIFRKLLTKFNLEKPGNWHFLTNHATIKTWILTKNDLEKPGVRPFWDPETLDGLKVKELGVQPPLNHVVKFKFSNQSLLLVIFLIDLTSKNTI